jgi:hypothetical protein
MFLDDYRRSGRRLRVSAAPASGRRKPAAALSVSFIPKILLTTETISVHRDISWPSYPLSGFVMT